MDGATYASSSATIKVVPKPVVLVHGFASSFVTWEDWTKPGGFIPAVHGDWTAIAVNLDMGSIWDDPFRPPPTNTVYESARQLSAMIDNIRRSENAWHVDIVAHSMGGLVSRRYIQDIMPPSLSPAEGPVVSHLIMLGTPNLGSSCAGLAWLTKLTGLGSAITPRFEPALTELTTSSVEAFNRVVTDIRGVPTYAVAGNLPQMSCGQGNGDGIVPVYSVLGSGVFNPTQIYLPNEIARAMHSNLKSGPNFEEYVLPWLAETVPASSAMVMAFSQPTGMVNEQSASEEETLAAIFGEVTEVLAGDSDDVTIPVPAASGLSVSFLTPAWVTATLIDPSGAVYETIAADLAVEDALLLSFSVPSPAAGDWVLRLENVGSEPAPVLIGAGVQGNPIMLSLDTGQPDPYGRALLKATLTDGEVPILGAQVDAILTGLSGEPVSLSLLDDGLHSDGLASDGVYAATSGPLTPDMYSVGVRAQTSAFYRLAQGIVEVTSVEPLPPIDLVVSITDVPDPVVTGQNLMYLLTVTNNGPVMATGVTLNDVLPDGFTFVSASPGDPTCRGADGAVSCNLGDLAASASVQAMIVGTAGPVPGYQLTNTATISANEEEIDPSNNSATQTTLVLQSVAIDIRPGDPHNTIALVASAPVPVLIFGSPNLDVQSIDPATIRLAGAPIIGQPQRRNAIVDRDDNRDGYLDRQVLIDSQYLELTAESTIAVLEGATFDGIGIWGSDAVRIRPQGQGAPVSLPTPALAPTFQPPGQ